MDEITDIAVEAAADAAVSAAPSGCSRRLRAILLGGLCAVVTLFAYWYFMASPRLPEIDRAQLEEARSLWRQNGPDDYDIEISVTGPRAAVYRVEVRRGKAASAMRDDSPLKDARTLGTWSVSGMFDTIESDVDHLEEPIVINARESHYVSPRAEFHPQYGYPQRYRRIEWGGDIEAGWAVTEFLIVP